MDHLFNARLIDPLHRRASQQRLLFHGGGQGSLSRSSSLSLHCHPGSTDLSSLQLRTSSPLYQSLLTPTTSSESGQDRLQIFPSTLRASPRQVLLQHQMSRHKDRQPVMKTAEEPSQPAEATLLPNGMAYRPSFDINIPPPFQDSSKTVGVFAYGVIKIQNIPYSVTSQEIKHFITRIYPGAPLISPNTQGSPIHIIIERATGKTLDCYVEFKTAQGAASCIDRMQSAHSRGRPLKIGQRHVQVDLSSQGELMSVLFPRAKSVAWDPATGHPQIIANADPHSEGFRGFFTIEEMASIVKHAQVPQRSPFSSRSMQRTYESMISTLYKFPWRASDRYTLAARDYLFTTYMAQLEVLVQKVNPPVTAMVHYNRDNTVFAEREVGLSHGLLMDFLFAGLNTPTFSMRQKFQITANCGHIGLGFPLSQHAFAWPFACLSPPFGFPEIGIEFWLKILSDGFDIMFNNGLSHGFEKYITVERDGYGFVCFRFTQIGNALHFQQGLTIEQTVMQQLIENGRMKFCADHNLPYTPLKRDQSASNELETRVEFIAPVLVSPDGDAEAARTMEEDHTRQGPTREEDLTSYTDGAFAFQFAQVDEAIRACAEKGMLNSQQAPPFLPGPGIGLRGEAKDFQKDLDPSTPDFVPAKPRFSAGSERASPTSSRLEAGLCRSEGKNGLLSSSAGYVRSTPKYSGLMVHTPSKHSGNANWPPSRSPNVDGSVVELSPSSINSSVLSEHQVIPTYSTGLPASGTGSLSTNLQGSARHPIGTITPPRGFSMRRRTINIDSTIEEEGEAGYDNTWGGVKLPGRVSDIGVSTQLYED